MFGCFDRTAVAAQMSEAGVVENDEENVRRSLLRPVGLRPRGLRDLGRAPDHAGECRSWFVFCESHLNVSLPLPLAVK